MTVITRWWRARRERQIRDLNEASWELLGPKIEAHLAAERDREARAAKNGAWFAEQRAKRDAEREAALSDPRGLLIQRLRVIQSEVDLEKRLVLAGAAMAQYISDPEVIEAWKGMA